jgi:hypothetical protein
MSEKNWKKIGSGLLVFSLIKGALMQAVRLSAHSNQEQVFQVPAIQVEPNSISETALPMPDSSILGRSKSKENSTTSSHRKTQVIVEREIEDVPKIPKDSRAESDSNQNEDYGDRGISQTVETNNTVNENSAGFSINDDRLNPPLNSGIQINSNIPSSNQKSYAVGEIPGAEGNVSLPKQQTSATPVIVFGDRLANQEEGVSSQNEASYDSTHSPDPNSSSENQASSEKDKFTTTRTPN